MDELRSIKKIYGDEMAHICRELFPTILETPGLLLSILKDNIAPTNQLATDIKENNYYEAFKNFIYSFANLEKETKVYSDKTPFELMDEVGYILYECKCEEDIQSFRKYYKGNEVICTIYMGGRLNRCHVFFAVKKNVDEIKRQDFFNPKRQDEYGTSVISIQFSRGKTNTLSIKNRYNHTVKNPDSTFSNNLENIIPGLTNSFEKYYNLNINQNIDSNADFLMDMNYIKANDNKYYRYNVEEDSIYYCEKNIIIEDGNVITKYSGKMAVRYTLADNYIIDNKEKTISLYKKQEDDSFIKSITELGKIEKITTTKENNTRTITIYIEGEKQVSIKVNNSNAIIGYENKYIDKIGDKYLELNKTLEELSLPNAKRIGSLFLLYNIALKKLSLPNVLSIGDDFLYSCEKIEEISLPNVIKIGYSFLSSARLLKSLSLPNAIEIGNTCLYENTALETLSLPNIKRLGFYFLFFHPRKEELLDSVLKHQNNEYEYSRTRKL